MYIHTLNNNSLAELLYIQKQKFSAGVLVHIKIKNLGSESKVIHCFPDFFVIKGFSQLSRRSLRNKKPPAMRVRDKS